MNKYPIYKDKNDNLYLVDEKKRYGIRLWSKDKSSMFKFTPLSSFSETHLEKTNRRLQIKIPPLILFPNDMIRDFLLDIEPYSGINLQIGSRVYNNFKNKIYTKNDPYMFSIDNKIYTHSKGSPRLFSIDLTKSRVIIKGMFEDGYFQNFREDDHYNPIPTPIRSDKCFFDSEGIFQTTDFEHKKLI